MKKSNNKPVKESDLKEINEDINNVLNLINSLNNIDEDYDVKGLEDKVDKMKEIIEIKYKDILDNQQNNLDTEE
jgi:predicted translin family RNA/ssDNA-binding protein